MLIKSRKITRAGQDYVAGIFCPIGDFQCQIRQGRALINSRPVSQQDEMARPGLIETTLDQLVEDFLHDRLH